MAREQLPETSGFKRAGVVLPTESDYPAEMFATDQASECRVGCARAYFKTNPIARRLFLRRVNVAFALMPDRHWKRALDAGTGAGFLLPGLAAIARDVVGVDLSCVLGYTRKMLDNRGLTGIPLYIADLMRLPFPAQSFDLIACLSVLEHIPDPTEAFAETRRLLHDNGVVVIGYPLAHPLQHFFEWAIKMEARVGLLLSGKARPKGKAFHPHVSGHLAIQRGWEPFFHADAIENIRFLGIPLYRMVRLVCI